MHNEYRDVSLIVVGHGSTVNPDSSQPLRLVVQQIRSRGMFGEVLDAHLKESPSIEEAFNAVSKQRVVIVPFFVSEGFFSTGIIPEKFGFPAGKDRFLRDHPVHGKQSCILSKPIGTHPAITGIILRQAEEVIKKHPFPRAPKNSEITLFIAGHGTPKDPRSKEAIENQVQAIASLNRYAKVQALYIEEDPKIEDFHLLAPTKNVVVVPFFVSNGMHTAEDIPRMLGEAERVIKSRLEARIPTWRNPSEKKGKLIWYSNSTGTEPEMLEIVLSRAKEALQAIEQP